MAARLTSGHRRCWAGTSATCRRTSNCWAARWRRTSRGSTPKRTRRRSSPQPRRPACMNSSPSLRKVYETHVGERGETLSAGQAQRIALARALYGDPFLVVLDEPNSNLDAEGDDALTRAILGVRRRNGIVVVVAHRPSAIAGLDLILAMTLGRQIEFGLK